MTGTKLHLPSGMNYGCLQCGRSCDMFDEVELDRESERKLSALGLVREDTVVESATKSGRRILAKRPDKKCVFLSPENLCEIHAKFGEENKPQTCKDFPWRFVETEAGVFVGLSFACTAVQQDHGPNVRSQSADLERHYPVAKSVREAKGRINLTNRIAIDVETYLVLEEALIELLKCADKPLRERLRAQAVLLDMATRAFDASQQRVGTPMELAEALLKMTRTEQGRGKIFGIASRMSASSALHRAFLGLITAFRQNLQVRNKPRSRFIVVGGIVRHYVMHWAQVGRVHLAALARDFEYSEFLRVPFNPDSPELSPLLDRFLIHLLERKDLLLGESVWLSHRFLLIQYALLKWHAVGVAALAGRDRVTAPDLREALGHIERHYVFHTPFAKLFEDHPMLGMVLDSLVKKPAFAAAMTGPVIKGDLA